MFAQGLGVLVECRAPHYVVGVGIDVDIAEFPAALLEERPMTSLALLGCATDRARIEAALLEALPRRVEGIESDPAGLAADFLAALRLAGRMVVADGLRGRLVALELERGLLLRTDEGGERWSPLETTSSLREA